MKEKSIHKSPNTTGASSSNSSPSSTAINPIFTSEVARAVCGYLSSVGCSSSRAAFIEEHPDLKDFNALAQKGLIRTVDNDIEGMGLFDIVNDYVMMKREIDTLVQNISPGNSEIGLLRSDGPLRKLKLLGTHLLSNSVSQSTKGYNEDSSLALSTTEKNGSADDLAQAKASTLKSKEWQRKMEASVVERKATEDEINRVLAKNGIKRGKACNNYRYNTNHLNTKILRGKGDENEITDKAIGEKKCSSLISRGPITFHIKPLIEVDSETNIEENSKDYFSNSNANSSTITKTCEFIKPFSTIHDSQKASTLTKEQQNKSQVEAQYVGREKGMCREDLQSKVQNSPFKSRKSALKSKTPKRIKFLADDSLASGSEAVRGEKVKKKLSMFTQESNEDLMNKLIAEPLANILASNENQEYGKQVTTDQVVKSTTDNFCSDSALLSKFMAVLDEIDLPEEHFTYNNEKEEQHDNIFSERFETTATEEFGKDCLVSTPIHHPEYINPVSTNSESESPKLVLNCGMESIEETEKEENDNKSNFQDRRKKNENLFSDTFHNSELSTEFRNNDKSSVVNKSDVVMDTSNIAQKVQSKIVGKDNLSDATVGKNTVEIEMKKIHNSPKRQHDFTKGSEKSLTTDNKLGSEDTCSKIHTSHDSMDTASDSFDIPIPHVMEKDKNVPTSHQISCQAILGFEARQIVTEDNIRFEAKDGTQESVNKCTDITLKNNSDCTEQTLNTAKKVKPLDSCKRVEHVNFDTSSSTNINISHEKNPQRSKNLPNIDENYIPSFGEMIARTVKARLSNQEPPDFEATINKRNNRSINLEDSSITKSTKDTSNECKKVEEHISVQNDIISLKGKNNSDSCTKEHNITYSNDAFVLPKVPNKRSEAHHEYHNYEEENVNLRHIERSVSSPAQRSFGYENNDSIFNRPMSSPITFDMSSQRASFHTRASKIKKHASVDNLRLHGSTGPNGIMVKVGDFKKSILVNEGSLQAGIIAPSPQKHRDNKSRTGIGDDASKIESYNMMLDVVTTVPNDAISIAVAETITNDHSKYQRSPDEKMKSANGNKKKGKKMQAEKTTIICYEQDPSGNYKEIKELKSNSTKKGYSTPLTLMSGENIINPTSPVTKVNFTGLNNLDSNRKKCALRPGNMSNFLTALKPILEKEINNLHLVNHISKPDNLNMTQLVDCFATSQMTILQQQTKDSILDGLHFSSQFYDKELYLDSAPSNTELQAVNTIQNISKCVAHPKSSNLQIETRDTNSIIHDETANHSPPKCTKTPTKMFGLQLFEMPTLELSNDTTTSNSRYRQIHSGYPLETQFEMKTPLVKQLDRERPLSSNTKKGEISTPQKLSECGNIYEKESQLSVSNMLNIEMQCKTPLKHKISPLKKKHVLPTMPSPTSFTHASRSPLLKSYATRKV